MIKYLKVNSELIILMISSIVLAIFYIYDGYVPGDQIFYAMGLQKIVENGIAEMAKAKDVYYIFNAEMSIGYYYLLYFLMNLMGQFASLSNLMNGISAISSVVLQCLLFLFFNSLLNNKKLSFFACVCTLFSPSLWSLSYIGHPAIISIMLFFASLLVFDKIACSEKNNYRQIYLSLLFILLLTLAMSIRLDIILSFGSFFGLLYFRGLLSIRSVARAVCLIFIGIGALLVLRYFVLGYLFSPTGGTLSYHIANRLEPEFIVRNIIKNSVTWSVSANLFIAFWAVFGFIRLGPTSGIGIFLLAWVLPYFIFFPFRGMNLSRYAAPSIPIISLVAMVCITSIFKKRKVFAMVIMVVLAQITAMIMYYPLVRVYPFKIEVDGRALAPFPLGFPPVDHHYVQRAISGYDKSAKMAINERDGNVLIIGCGGPLLYYKFYLHQYRSILSVKKITCNGVVLRRYITPENLFYVLNIDNNWLIKDPIRRAIGCVNIDRNKIHVMPFWMEYQIDEKQIYLNEKNIESILEQEAAIMDVRRKLIHY